MKKTNIVSALFLALYAIVGTVAGVAFAAQNFNPSGTFGQTYAVLMDQTTGQQFGTAGHPLIVTGPGGSGCSTTASQIVTFGCPVVFSPVSGVPITANAPSAGASLLSLADSFLSGAATFSYSPNWVVPDELSLRTNVLGNSLALYNANPNAEASLTFHANDGYEHMALGVQNSANPNGSILDFLELSSYPSIALTGSITGGNLLTVTGTPSRVLAVGQFISVSGTALGQISSLGTGTGGAGTYNLTNGVNIASQALNASIPPNAFHIYETGTQAGQFRSLFDLFSIDNTGKIRTRKYTNNETFSIDPVSTITNVDYILQVGYAAPAQAPPTSVTLDQVGLACLGSNANGRSFDCTKDVTIESSTPDFRIVRTSTQKVDIALNASPNRLDFIATDQSGSPTVMSLALDGTNKVTVGTLNDAALTASLPVCTDASKNLTSTCPTGNGSGAPQTVTYQPGLLTAVNATIGVFKTFVKASTVDNLVGSAVTFSCVSNPTVTLYECGTSSTCATPTTIGTVTVTAAGTRFTGTVSSPAIAAGDSIGWAITAGTCASIDIAGNAEVHAN